jgi:hypothetical protein
MKYITTIISKFIKKELPKPLGRWNIDYCSKKTDQKVDLSNEDHCGPCGQYVVDKKTSEKKTEPTIEKNL